MSLARQFSVYQFWRKILKEIGRLDDFISKLPKLKTLELGITRSVLDLLFLLILSLYQGNCLKLQPIVSNRLVSYSLALSLQIQIYNYIYMSCHPPILKTISNNSTYQCYPQDNQVSESIQMGQQQTAIGLSPPPEFTLSSLSWLIHWNLNGRKLKPTIID